MQGACSLVLSHGRYEEALNAANECLRLAQELGESIAEATAMAMIGFIAVSVGEYEQCVNRCDRRSSSTSGSGIGERLRASA